MTSDLNATFGHRPFIKDRREASLRLSLPRMGNAIKLSGRTFLAPHRGSSPMGLCKRTGFLGVKRRENPVRLHILPSALPPNGEARRYVANDFLNLIALPAWERGTAIAVDRVLSYIVDLRRSPSLSFIPLEPYPAHSARHLPHAGKALSVGIVFPHMRVFVLTMREKRCSRIVAFPLGVMLLS